jgi:hypothetical protein
MGKRGLRMKRLLTAIILAALAYSGWWIYASNALRSDVAGWFQDQRYAGLSASYSDLTVRGFPNRTDLTITDPFLEDADSQIGWQAPFLQILGLTYKKGHVIVAWPDTQIFTTDQRTIGVSSDGLRASVIHEDGTLIRSSLEATVLNLNSPDRSIAMAEVNAAIQRIETTAADYRVAISVGSFAASTPDVSTSIGPDSLASFRAELDLGLDQPITFDALSHQTPQPTRIAIHRSEVRYGAVTFRLDGQADLDAQGRASGEITVSADNWRDALETVRANGDFPSALSEGLIEMLTLLATLSGARDTLDVTLGLEQGTVFVGPIPIGQLPPLRWR